MKKILVQYRWLVKKMWHQKKMVIIVCMISCLFGASLGTLLSYAQKFFLYNVQHHSNVSVVTIIALFLFVFFIFLQSLYGYIDSYFAHKLVQTATYTFNKLYVFRMYHEEHVRYFQTEFNDQINKVNIGLNIIPYQILQMNELLFYLLVLCFVDLPIILYYEPIMVCFLLAGVVYKRCFYPKLAVKKYKLTQALVREKRKADYYGDVLTTKTYAKEIRVFHLGNFFFNKYHKSYFRTVKDNEAFDIKQEKMKILGNCIDMFLYCLVLLFLLYKLLVNQIELSTFVFLYTIYTNCNNMLMTVIQTSYSDLYQNYYNINNYYEFVKEVDYKNQILSNRESKLVCGPFEELQVKKVSFQYPTANQYTVKDVSFTIKKGEIVSILGYNGSGKTTLTKLLTGLYKPNKGKIYMNGKNIDEYPQEDVFEYFGIAYQEFTRYCLSLSDNVKFGYIEKATDEQIKESIQKSGFDMEKNHLTNDTILGKIYDKKGVDLSGGEWQRLALARAYIANHEIIILDEPTASIDPLQEMNLLSNLKDILKGRTCILISHRIGFARLADRIMFMEDGNIIENGTHEELIKLNGNYKEIFQAQKELYNF